MKILILLFILSAWMLPVRAQVFYRVTTDTLAKSPGDSRSVNIVDLNNDGYDDVFISNGPAGGENNMLFMNNGNGSFTRISNDTIVKDHSPSDGATFADVDNDGDLDCYVVSWYNQKNYFYLNNGNGTFTRPGIYPFEQINTYSETAAWGDYDRNGYVDLYITNSAGGQKNVLYRNDGISGGILLFTKITDQPPVLDAKTSRSANWVDVNNDGNPDLFVSHEANEKNDLFLNLGDGNFLKMINDPLVTVLTSTISSSWGDVDNDMDMDVVLANSGNFQQINNMLFMNNGDVIFNGITSGDIVQDGGCSFGSTMGDFDNDGDPDIFIANGYCNGVIKNFYYRNEGNGIFIRDTLAFPDLTTPCSYGVANGDLNNDGFLDLVVATCKNHPQDVEPADLVYYNTPNSNHWLKIRLNGTLSNKAAIGAKIKIKAMIDGIPVWQMHEVTAQSGYCGQNSLTQHFGLKNAGNVDSLVVLWPSGQTQILTGISSNQTMEITETGSSGIGDDKLPGVRIFPNPTSGKVIIISGNEPPDPSSVTLTDLTGRKMKLLHPIHSGSSLVLDLHELTRGSYVLTFSRNKKIFREKIILL